MEEDDDYAGFDTSSDDEDATVPCPHCGADVYDDAEQCPTCGQYLSHIDAPAAGRSWWIVGGALICLLIVIWWMLSG
jgi:hypothetical protein